MAKPSTRRRQRQWFSFRLSTLFLVVTVVGIGFGYRHVHRYIQFQRFKAFVGRDIRTLPELERKRFDGIVNALLPAQPKSSFSFRENWFVWQLPTPRGTRLILFQGQHILIIPGASSAHVHLFDTAGRLVGQSSFSTGWRIDVDDASLIPDKLDGEALIRIDTHPDINGSDIRTQYYAVIDDALVLLRLEDSGGNYIRNDYAAPNHTIGPAVPPRAEADWIHALSSPRAADVLRTLVWLGASHSRPIENPGNVHIESFKDAALYLKVLNDPHTKIALERLAVSTNPWISEAAQLVLQSLDKSR